MSSEEICPVCRRKLGDSWDRHHLVPKTFKGKEVVNIHRICHRKIHSVFTERELMRYFNTVERILENEEMKKFVRWVAKKPIDFYDSSKDSKRKRRR